MGHDFLLYKMGLVSVSKEMSVKHLQNASDLYKYICV